MAAAQMALEDEKSHEFEFGEDGHFMSDNAPLFMKLRESERRRKLRLREATQGEAALMGKGLTFQKGIFGQGLLNPFLPPPDR